MENFSILHSKKIRNLKLVFGLAGLLIGILGFLIQDWSDLRLIIGIAVFHFAQWIYDTLAPYIQVKDGFLKTNSAPFKRINLDKVEKVKKFLDEYSIVSQETEIILSENLIDEKDKEKLHRFIEKIRLVENLNSSSFDSKISLTTRKYYLGEQKLSLIVNGVEIDQTKFTLN